MGRRNKGLAEAQCQEQFSRPIRARDACDESELSQSVQARDAMIETADLDAERRALWRRYWRGSMAHYAACEARWQVWRANPKGPPPDDPPSPDDPFPEVLRGLTCGARTRGGTPCKRTDLYRSGRCKLHGGLSTGPTSPEGKVIASRNAKRTP